MNALLTCVQDDQLPQDLLYFFQFPEPFPEFVSKASAEGKGKAVAKPEDGSKTVTFSEDTKPPAPSAPQEQAGEKNPTEQKLDGVIGQLEVYESGAVKMRLSNGIVMDVSLSCLPCTTQANGVFASGVRRYAAVVPPTCRIPGPGGEATMRLG